MKKVLLGLLTTVVLGISAQAQGSNSEQRAINRAEAAARECLHESSLPNNYELVSFATLNLYCDYLRPSPNYAGYSVEVYARPNCPPNQACIQVIYPVATVLVDCQGNPYQVDCANRVIIGL